MQFNSSATPAAISSVLDGLSALPSTIPNILCYRFYPLLTADVLPAGHLVHPAGFTHILDSLFTSADALRLYDQHPAHHPLQLQLEPLLQKILHVDSEMPGLDVDAFLRAQRTPNVHRLTLVRPREGMDRTEIGPTLQKWGALPTTVPELVWASVGFSANQTLFDGWQDRTQGYSVVSDMVARDLPSMVVYTKSASYQELMPHVKKMTDLDNGGLIAVEWQL